jgi:branched-chain amino acid aminotransferase
MDRLIYFRERIVAVDEAGIDVTNAGLLYGWGVFTTVRVTNGKVFALDRYIDRLVQHSERARIPAPADLGMLKDGIRELILANSVVEGRARITLLRGNAGAWRTASGPASETLVFTSSESQSPARGIAMTVSPYRLLSSSPLAGVKRTAMAEHLLALEEARSRGFTDAAMLNERGEIVSATSGNLFWVEGDELFTPALATGCVDGVTRGFVCEIARRIGIYLIEGSFPLQRLIDAKEAFLTSTSRQVTPVVGFDIKQYGVRPGQITRNISREFQRLVGDARIKT